MEERRSNILIDFPVQLRLVGLVILSAILTVILSIGYAVFMLNLLNPHLSISQETYNMIWEELYLTTMLVGGTWVIGLAIMSFITLIVTNRFVGPLNRLTRELKEMRETRQVHLITVREDDYVDDFVRSLNKLLLFVEDESDSLSIEDSPPSSLETDNL